MFSRFFIDRPIFATVLSVVVVLLGAASLRGLPVERFPDVVPPTVQVTAVYPGADAQTVADTVAAPIEQQVNGVDGMLYMSSVSSGDGTYVLTVTFRLGTDPDQASVLVQNRVSAAEAVLPEEVRRQGVTTRKQSSSLIQVVHLYSPDGRYDDLFLTNYAGIRVVDELARIPGVGAVRVFPSKDYGMRIWLDPERMRGRNLTVPEVLAALREQNVQVAAGRIGDPPAPPGQQFQYTVNAKGRLTEVEEFEGLIVRTGAGGRLTRLRDVARVELGGRDYNVVSKRNGKPAAAMILYQSPGANALEISRRSVEVMERLSKSFPQGLAYSVTLDTTEFVSASVHEVVKTLIEAFVLVFVVVFVFLQDWRATLVPMLTIPVSLIGTFAFMAAFGFSLNTLTLFGLVLAIGIVVDDAIVVVENVARNMEEHKLPAREAAIRAMEEVTGPVIAVALVLAAVFLPAAFLGGISGQFFRQFALTIAVSTALSALCALTLSPALCALLLRPPEAGRDLVRRLLDPVLFRPFNWVFDRLTGGYAATVRLATARLAVPAMLLAFLGISAAGGAAFARLPTGFLPDEDQGYVIVLVKLPDGASLERTSAVVDRVVETCLGTDGIRSAISFAGFSPIEGVNLPNSAVVFCTLTDWKERPGGPAGPLYFSKILGNLSGRLAGVPEAVAFAVNPPSLPGLGASGGFQMMLQDRGGAGFATLQQVTDGLTADANTQSGVAGVYTTLRTTVPQLYADVDREKAKTLGFDLAVVHGTLQTMLGSAYVNDFNKFGRTWQVRVQADARFRSRPEDIGRLELRGPAGGTMPLGTLVKVRDDFAPQVVTRYNLYPAAAVYGAPGPGASSGQALAIMEQAAASRLPLSMDYEWTALAYQEKAAGNDGPFVAAFGLLLVFLILAAQYESWTLPAGVVLAVPLALVGAAAAVSIRGLDNNIFTQVGLVLLVAMAAKNAILIVEFAVEIRRHGKTIREAAVEAARLRFRPILMTSLAFILGVVPLVTADGAGAAGQRALGTAIFGGMIAATLLPILFVPVFFLVTRSLGERGTAAAAAAPAPAEPALAAPAPAAPPEH